MISNKTWRHGSVLCSLYLLGCGGGSGQEAATLTPPALELRAITGAGASGWKSGQPTGCVELGKDAARTIVVQTNLTGNWLLRPLGACDKSVQCGFIEASVSDLDGNTLLSRTAATEAIELPFADLADPEGVRQFTVRLLSDDGTEFFIGDGGTVCGAAPDCAISLEVRKNCGSDGADGGTNSDAGLDSDAGDSGVPHDGGDAAGIPDATPADASDPLDATTPDASADATATLPDASTEQPDAGSNDASLLDAAVDADAN